MSRRFAGVIALSLTSALAGCGGFADTGQPPVERRSVTQACGCAASFVLDGALAEAASPAGCYLPVGVEPATLPPCAGPAQATPPAHACVCAQQLLVAGALVEYLSPAGCYTSAEAGLPAGALPTCHPGWPLYPGRPSPQVP